MIYAEGKTEESLSPILDEAIRQLVALGPAYAADAAKLTELKDRLASGQFHLAVLGQFKRGKSTLLNALLGQNVLPTAVVPLTAVPTWIRFGRTPRARVEFRSAAAPEEFATADPAELCRFLTQFVTESGNPHNRLGVARVEVFHPAEILRSGVVFIDTPGIGSTLRHNTETTLHFLPQCDAAVFLISADPPVTEAEVEFLKMVRPNVNRLFFVLNKADYLNPAEVDDAVTFFRKVISQQAKEEHESPIFPVSARDGLKAKSIGDSELWRRSGMDQVEGRLLGFLAREKMDSLRGAVQHKAIDIVADVVMRLRLSLRTLELPLEDLLARMKTFDHRIKDLHRERVAAHDLLAGDKKRTHEFLQEQHGRLCKHGMLRLNHVLDHAIAAAGAQPLNENDLQETLRTAIPDLFESEFKDAIEIFDRRLAEVLRPHQERTDRLVESIRKTAADLFDVPYRPMDNSVAFDATREPFWLTYRYEHVFGPISPGMIDMLIPPRLRRRRIERRFRNKIEALVLYNAGKLREKLYDQIELTFRRFRRSLDERLAATIAATHGAAQAALKKRETHAGVVAGDVERLGAAIGALEEIGARLIDTPGMS
ncbi:MAG: dynamin family protein [Tepidisphaeraceae bacterium]|jgi:GTP-binding protein EngB required for normal cell division